MGENESKGNVTPDLAEQIIQHNRLTHAALARVYDLSHPNMFNWYERRLLREDIELIRSLAASRDSVKVLDVGTGTGRLALEFVRLGWSVDGLDLSPEMLAMCQAKYDALPQRKGTLRVVCSEVDEALTDLSGPYDVASFSSVLHHLPYYLTTVRTSLSVLRPNGIVYITQEPMIPTRQYRTLAVRAVEFVDKALGSPHYIRKQIVRFMCKVPRNMPLTDYYVPRGLDVPRIIAMLESEGFVIKWLRPYNDGKTGIMAWLQNNVLPTPKRLFRLIAQRIH